VAGEQGCVGGLLVIIIEVPSMPAAAGLVKACVIEAVAPYGQPGVLWHWKGSLGDATQKQKSAGRMAGV
jgi:hypothetical protein